MDTKAVSVSANSEDIVKALGEASKWDVLDDKVELQKAIELEKEDEEEEEDFV